MHQIHCSVQNSFSAPQPRLISSADMTGCNLHCCLPWQMPVCPITQARGGLCFMSLRGWHISHRGAWESGGERREEEDVCSGCRAAIFVLFPSHNVSAGSYLRHYILSGARADCVRSCPCARIAQAWFPWEHLRRRMLGFQAFCGLG